MKNMNLEKMWDRLVYNGSSEFIFTRMDSVCIPELNLGLNSSLDRCLLLELPKDHSVDFQTTVRQNLTLTFFKDTDYIVLQLTDGTYYDLFNDLIISLYQKIYDLSNVAEYSKVFIQTFHKWSEFFEDEKTDRLTREIIKGLFGELLVLKSLVNSSSSSKINDALNSWKGPYDQGHDFVLDDKIIEVKTKDISKVEIGISSEYQLEKELDEKLELLVVSVESEPVNGISIKDLIHEIKNSIIDKLGDCSILLKAIRQKGLTYKNIPEYDNFKFKPINQIVYDCADDDFPKLVKSNTPEALNNIKYNIKISSLNKFIISEKEF